MAKETTRTGFVERATVEVVTPQALPDFVVGWYWYKGEPVYAYYEHSDAPLIVRGYNFTTKEEWRRTDLDLSELRPCQ